MFLFIFYALAGFCLLLLATGLFYKSFWKGIQRQKRPHVRLALVFFGLGLILSAGYQAYVYYILGPEIRLQRSPAQEGTSPNEK